MTVKVKRGRNQLPIPGTPAGDQLRNEFLHDLEHIFGDTRLLWVPNPTDASPSVDTDESRHARTITHNENVVTSRRTRLGSGYQIDLDGDDDEADTPDQANLSFGDGAVDQPFSLVVLMNRDTDASAQTLISKQNSATVDEWELHLNTSGHPQFDLIDASNSAIIGREDQTDIGTSDVLLVATYDGSGAATGMRLYKDAARVDDGNSDADTGTYTAMEDTASLVRFGTRYSTNERFYNGKMALAAVVGKAISIDEVWAVKEACNGFFGLSL